MPDASTPLNEDNVAEALQGIKDARQLEREACLPRMNGKLNLSDAWIEPAKKADIVQVFALRLDAGPEVSRLRHRNDVLAMLTRPATVPFSYHRPR